MSSGRMARIGCILLLATLPGCSDDVTRPRSEAGGADGTADRTMPGELPNLAEAGAREAGGREAGPREAGKPDGPAPVGLAAKYPGDVGIDKDPAVVFYEGFEGSLATVVARYSDQKNQAGMALVSDVPSGSAGKTSIKMTAGGSTPATHLYTRLLPGHDELYLRYYVKYQSGINWHHSSVWLNGYNPSLAWPNPQAGIKPSGSDRFSVAVEPMGQGSAPGPRLDFYNYWMKMHSWMDQPSGNTAYWGNTLIHQKGFVTQNDAWMCIEVQLKLNPGTSSGAGAELAVWKNDQLVQRFTDKTPVGYWVKDKFCPTTADNPSCTDYPPPSGTTMKPLDLQFRTTTALKINSVWPQNYITEGPAGSLWYDDMVIAKTRIGCLR